MISLFPHQEIAVESLRTGSILCGGVGSGKSLTSIAYFYKKECSGDIINGSLIKMKNPKDLFIITTAAKRDTLDWDKECLKFLISYDNKNSLNQISLKIDSWNNIKKYTNVKDAFFIFDEQRLVGSGSWVKSFISITKHNNWILLSATPGDTWMDYIPVFIANGFYKNRTQFLREHVVYNSFTKYPKVDRYVEVSKLERLKRSILVYMDYERVTNKIYKNILVKYDIDKFNKVYKDRWNPIDNKPVKDVSQYFFLMRRIVNSDISRLEEIKKLFIKHKKIIVFYNFNYELDILRSLKNDGIIVSEYNGENHDEIPKEDSWIYLVQYLAGSEGWNCTVTDTIVFYSLNYSYRIMTQAAGRTDRINTNFKDLYYYNLITNSYIDKAILNSLKLKKNFNQPKNINFLRAENT